MNSITYYYGKYGATASLTIIGAGCVTLLFNKYASETLILSGSTLFTLWLWAIFFTEKGLKGAMETFK